MLSNIRSVSMIVLVYVGFVQFLSAGTSQHKPGEKLPSTWELIRKSQMKRTESAEPASTQRVLHFPKERTLGQLMIQDANVVRNIQTFYYWTGAGDTEWEDLCEAEGDVTVPAGKHLSLTISPKEWKDLSPLSKLEPDDLYSLGFRNTDDGAKPDDRCISHIAHLTGLKELRLEWTNIGDNGLKLIKDFRSLECLGLPRRVTDVGFAYVAELSSLKRLYFKDNRITNAGLPHLKKLTKLEELELGGGYKDQTGRIHKSRINDDGPVHLKNLPNLSYLLLWGDFSDAGLVYLKDIP